MVIKKLLERELNWKNWIKASCPPFEKFPIKKNEEIALSDDLPVKGSKIIISFFIILTVTTFFVFICITMYYLQFIFFSLKNIIRCSFFFINFNFFLTYLFLFKSLTY